MCNRIAILVDGGFYRRRAQAVFGAKAPAERANELFRYCCKHVSDRHIKFNLYRVFYYDCPPMSKKVYHPLLKKTVDYGKTELYDWMNGFISELSTKRKVAIRLGELADAQAGFQLKSDVLKRLCDGRISPSDLKEEDFFLSVMQKGVDMKIGVDIASLAYKKQVDKIVLISGDSDFVPAAKLARREGIDFVLDPMHAKIKPNLSEHIDGLCSQVAYFENKDGLEQT